MTAPNSRDSGIRRSIKPVTIIIVVVAAAALGGIISLGITQGPRLFAASPSAQTGQRSLEEVQKLWQEKDYEQVIAACEPTLKLRPLEFDYLLYSGFANFYFGCGQETIETRNQYLFESVAQLRKAMVIEPHRNNNDIRYILGKAYYHLGYFYHDLSHRYLQEALKAGYNAEDLSEFLGMVASSLGKADEAIEHFKRAMNDNNRDAIRLALASAYLSMEKIDDAAMNVNEILASTKDPVIALRARYLRADLYARAGKTDLAMADYQSILKDDPESADAHYYVGEMYFLAGDVVKARAEWRAAVNLNPKHSGALNRLNTGM